MRPEGLEAVKYVCECISIFSDPEGAYRINMVF
jgi:hypothetical protein